jgi:hypothetical protein
MDINDKVNIRGTVIAWADFTIKAWREKMDKLIVGQSRDLENSFTRMLKLDKDGTGSVIFNFNFYGRFVDMGVGKGVNAGEKGDRTNLRNAMVKGRSKLTRGLFTEMYGLKRVPKKWYNKTLANRQHVLAELLADRYAINMAVVVKDQIQQKNGN